MATRKSRDMLPFLVTDWNNGFLSSILMRLSSTALFSTALASLIASRIGVSASRSAVSVR